MHACPDCGMACDCDDDLWRDWPFTLDCTHECDEEDDDGWIFDDEVIWYAPHNIALSDRLY